MDKDISKGWLMFLSDIWNSTNEDKRHAYILIERDSIRKGHHYQTIRQLVKNG